MAEKTATLGAAHPDFPDALRQSGRVARIWALGNTAILREPLVGFLCSAKCPGDIILQTYDLARDLRDAEVPVIGGFHSPMERECLDLLLRGQQPVVVCPARGIEGMRVPPPWMAPMSEGRLLVLSPFDSRSRRVTGELAERRNRFVAELSSSLLVPHAAPGGKIEKLSLDLLRANRRVLTLDCPPNRALMEAGAVPVDRSSLAGQLHQTGQSHEL
jgi:predicted Rossmann fold nucleotide-binding protein DprA/Smf involved in DNA uptake